MKTIKTLLLLLPAVLWFGCSTEELPMDDGEDAVPSSIGIERKNQALDDYARALASALRNKELRQLVRRQASLRVDGDFDVLVSRLEALKLDGASCSVGAYLRSAARTVSRQQTALDAEDSLSMDVVDVLPDVQVSVPVHCETWDPDRYVPMVAVLPCDYKEISGGTVKAYDAEGNLHELQTDEEPGVPVVVVGRSERMAADGTLKGLLPSLAVARTGPMVRVPLAVSDYPESLLLLHGPARSLLLQWTDVADETGYEVWRISNGTFQKIGTTSANDNNYVDAGLTPNVKYWYKVRAVKSDGYSSWSPVMATTASNRSDNEWLRVKRMRFSSSALKAVESWICGAPEIRLRVVQGSANGAANVFTSGRLEPASRGDINEQWWSRDVAIFAWSTSVFGTVLTFDWREEDWLENVDFTLSGSYEDKSSGGTVKVGGTVTVKGDEGGDVIGNTSVMWWQDKAQVYDLSGFQWQFYY